MRVDVAVTKPFWNRTRQPVGCSGSVAKCQNRPQCYSAGSSIATRPRTASDPGCFPYCLSLLMPSGIWRAPMADCRGRGGRRCEASGRQGGPMGSLGFVSQPNTHTNFPAYFFTATLNRHGERGHARGRPHDLAHHDGLRYGRASSCRSTWPSENIDIEQRDGCGCAEDALENCGAALSVSIRWGSSSCIPKAVLAARRAPASSSADRIHIRVADS